MRKNIIIITGFFLVVYIISFAGKCSYSALPTGTGVSSGKLRIFVTNTTYQGNLGGAAGADAKCNDPMDTNKPSTGYYRALIMDSTRNSTSHPNWALKPQTMYYRSSDMLLLGTTDSGRKLIFPLTNQLTGGLNQVWTGIDGGWNLNADNCTDWTSGVAGNGARGSSMDTLSAFIYQSSSPCNSSIRLYCVEQ